MGRVDYSDVSVNTFWDDRRAGRDLERELAPRRPRIPLSERGAVRARFVPVCSQAEHDAIKADDARWLSLEYVGMQPTYDEPGQPQEDELRNCTCGSTLNRPVTP